MPSLSSRSTEDAEPPAVPKMSANAGSPVPETDAALAETEPPGVTSVADLTNPTVALQPDPFQVEHEAVIAPASESRVEQLKQALTEDTQRTTDADQTSLRLRIDALLRKSAQLWQSGQFAEGRLAAQRATELAEESQISFLPTEERPSDVLRQMTQALDEAAANVASVIPVDHVASPAEEPLGSRRDDALPPMRGQVAANRPIRLASPERSPDDALRLPAIDVPAVDEQSEPLPEQDVPATSASTRALLAEGRELPAGPDLKLPDRAPEPPSIDPLQPLPKFRSEDRPVVAAQHLPPEAIPLPGTGLSGWSLWGPVISVAMIAAVVGLGLLGRQWLTWRRTPRA